MDEITARLAQHRVVPVLALNDETAARAVARALLAGGIDVLEVTYRTRAASAVISRLRRELPQLLVLAGTVLEAAQVAAAAAAGAHAIVAPALNREIVDAALAAQLAVIPGVATATEVDYARRLGISLVKVFPAAQLGGAPYLNALHAVYPGMRFLPTGGLTLDSLRHYASLEFVVACGLGSIAPPHLIDAHGFDEISARARQARELMQIKAPS